MKFNKILTIAIGESSLDPEYWKRLDSLAEKRVSLSKDSPEIKHHLADTDCLLVGFLADVGRDLIDIAPRLKYIGVLATAFGRVDVEYARSKGIVVCNIPGYSTESVAEFVFATILEHIRELEKAKRVARDGDYSGEGFTATEIKGKVFGVIGTGRIGKRVAEIASGFGADVRYWSKNRKRELEAKGIKYEEAELLIPKCDFISMHLAKNDETKNFFNRERVNKIKKGTVIINTGPMDLFDLNALEHRLRNGDVTLILDHSDEMGSELKLLQQHKNCIVYPPIAYLSKEGRIAKQEIFINNIENFLRGGAINTV